MERTVPCALRDFVYGPETKFLCPIEVKVEFSGSSSSHCLKYLGDHFISSSKCNLYCLSVIRGFISIS